MAITGIGNNYNNMYEGTYAAQKNETSKKADTKEAASAQAGDTKKAGTDSVSDYYSYLQKNYDCVKNGSVAISGSYLKECAKNPGKAKELGEKVRERKEEKQEQLDKLQENMRKEIEETGKEQFGDKFKGVVVSAKNEETAAVAKETGVIGANMDLKV